MDYEIRKKYVYTIEKAFILCRKNPAYKGVYHRHLFRPYPIFLGISFYMQQLL